MSSLVAITRAVSRALARCELTHLARRPIDVELARVQHRAYEEALTSLGVRVIALPEEPELPDSVFVEDAAVVTPEVAIVTRPGAASRRAETAAIAQALAAHRGLSAIESPGLVDGGDVLRIGKTLYVGRSGRTNQAAIDQLGRALSPHGYTVVGVAVTGCLHLKSAVTQVARTTVLVNPAWVDPGVFGMAHIEVDPSEPAAANALLVGEGVIYPASCPATRRRLEQAGIAVTSVDVSELEKAEGAVTCCSLLFEA